MKEIRVDWQRIAGYPALAHTAFKEVFAGSVQ
jgi:hypothetical protein